MATAAELYIGQEVQLFQWVPGGDVEVARGVLEKIGRTLVTIGDGHGFSTEYRIRDQTMNCGRGSYYFKTLDQVAEDERRGSALVVLKKHGLEVQLGKTLSLAKLEAVAAALEELGEA